MESQQAPQPAAQRASPTGEEAPGARVAEEGSLGLFVTELNVGMLRCEWQDQQDPAHAFHAW